MSDISPLRVSIVVGNPAIYCDIDKEREIKSVCERERERDG